LGSEGARVVTGVKAILQNPVEFHGFKGNFLNTFTLPENLKMQEVEKGQETMEL
jgi:hypothetical protein